MSKGLIGMNCKFRKTIALAAAAAMITSVSAGSFTEGQLMSVKASAASVLTTAEITKNMGVGWNLGNSLDANNPGFSSSDIKAYETQWSNPVVTESLIKKVKEKGFNTIRIPITWYQHISNDGSYTIDSAWMNRVKEVVDYAYNNDMYVIINVHHETWINRSDFHNAGDAMEKQLRAVWKQIAAAFADYDQKLIFEGMNEPREVGGNISEWVGDQSCYEVVNQLNDAFVETVRSVESPYRQTRMLMVPDYAASRENYIYSYLTIPKASGSLDADNDGDDDYIAVSLHAYSPYEFAMGGGDHSNFSSSYEAELEGMFSAMQSTFLQEGVPIVLGEFSASNYGYDDARIAWAEAYMRNATEYGIPCVLWDNNVEANGGGEAHGYINRSSLTWYNSGEKVVNQLIYTRNNTEWATKSYISYPIYSHADFNSGTSVTVADDGNISVSCISGWGEGKEIAVKYNGGDVLPVFALMNSSWGGWTTLTPFDFDKDMGIAYFSYDQIVKTWNTSNGSLCYIKLTNKGDIGFGGAALLDFTGGEADTTFRIKINPSDVTVTEGKSAKFTVSAAGENLTYQWQRSTDNGSSWANISGAASSSYSVTASPDMDGYLYRCKVSDGNETLTTNSAKLSVRSAAASDAHNDYSSGAYVAIESDGVIKLYNNTGFGAGKEFAVKFNGSTLPVIELMDMEWGGWVQFTVTDVDYENKIAYISYDELMKHWALSDSSNELVHVKIGNIDNIGFEGVVMLDITANTPSDDPVVPDDEPTLEEMINIINALIDDNGIFYLTEIQLEYIERIIENDYA